MRVFQEEIFGPVVAVTTFKDKEDALAIANDSAFGLGAGVWTRDGTLAYRMGRGIKAGRVWTNCYHLYPAHAAFGGYKKSGIGRETHKMMLEHYQQTKNLLVSYSPKRTGLLLSAADPPAWRTCAAQRRTRRGVVLATQRSHWLQARRTLPRAGAGFSPAPVCWRNTMIETCHPDPCGCRFNRTADCQAWPGVIPSVGWLL